MYHPNPASRRVLAVLLTILAAMVTALAVQQPAQAAGCYRSSCNGQDPMDMGCANDARNLESFWYRGGSMYLQGTLLELRYSPACDAAWVRTTGGDCWYEWRPCSAVLQVKNNPGAEQATGPSGGQNWTGMWTYREYVRGCFRSGYPDMHIDGCTAWR